MPPPAAVMQAIAGMIALVLSAFITGVVMFLCDRTVPVATNAATAFPNVAPVVQRAPLLQDSTCVKLCGDKPCPTYKLQHTCDTCSAEEVARLDLKVQSPDPNWPTVAQDQRTLNNGGDTFCLPTRTHCLGDQLVRCEQDTDCSRCDDALPEGETMACQLLQTDKPVTLNGNTITPAADGLYCVPTLRSCSYKTGGIATWSDNSGWVCNCKYPELFGGEACDQLVACQGADLAPWAKDYQKLLLNTPANNDDGTMSAIGDAWRPDSDVDPYKCLDAENKQVQCAEGLQPTVACRCDGMQAGTQATYTYVDKQPLECAIDPCFQNVYGGRTMKKAGDGVTDRATNKDLNAFSTFYETPNQPPTTCSCSGFGSSLYTYKDGAFAFTGHCEATTIPHTKITLPATNTGPVCKKKINNDSSATLLVPGKTAEGGDKCTPDPCAGKYSDPGFRTEQNIGSFNLEKGACDCKSADCPDPSVCPYVTTVPVALTECDHVVNPVCSYCADACQGPDPCPVAEGSSCPDARCKTGADGSKQCECGASCFYFSGKCHTKIQKGCSCDGFMGAEGACVNPGDECKVIVSYRAGLKLKKAHEKIMCYSKHQYECGEYTAFLTPCGGKSQISFPEC